MRTNFYSLHRDFKEGLITSIFIAFNIFYRLALIITLKPWILHNSNQLLAIQCLYMFIDAQCTRFILSYIIKIFDIEILIIDTHIFPSVNLSSKMYSSLTKITSQLCPYIQFPLPYGKYLKQQETDIHPVNSQERKKGGGDDR